MKSKLLLTTAVFLSSVLYTGENSPKEMPYNFPLTKEEQFELVNSFDSIISNIKYERDSMEKIDKKLYFDFSNFKLKTSLDTLSDYWQSPEETIKRGKGDCEDKAILLNDLLGKKGLETKLFFGKINPSRRGHVWQEFKIGDENYIIESSESIKIYNRDSLREDQEYIKIRNDSRIIDRIKEYEKRNGVGLNF